MNYVYIENLGCAKNQVDAEVMLALLTESGRWAHTENPEQADLILVNTCGFIESAREESITALLSLRSSFPDAKVMMTGCLSERYAELIAEDLFEADGFFGNRDLSGVLQAADAVMAQQRAVDLPKTYRELSVDRDHRFSFPGSTYLKLSEGCSHRCRYCAIPLIRGDLRSKAVSDVVKEFRLALDRGIYEVNLVAQDLAAFGTESGPSRFLELLEKLLALDGEFRIRMLYIHPDYFPMELANLANTEEKLLPYFDIPLQHASADVLRGMGRKGDADAYLSLIDTIRSRCADSVIRSTFMVGFPGEGEREFDELMRFAEAAQLDWAGVFAYSREEGTPAYGDRKAGEHRKLLRVFEERSNRLRELVTGISESRLDRWVGRSMDILIEEVIAQEDLAIGRGFPQAPEVDGSVVVRGAGLSAGTVVPCNIVKRNGIDLEAVPQEGQDD